MKNTKKLVISILCIFMSLVLLISCQVTPSESTEDHPQETEPKKEQMKIDLSEYNVIVSAYCPAGLRREAVNLKDSLNAKFGLNMKLSSDLFSDGAEAKEILVGATKFEESSKALYGVEEGRFVITVIGNKIIINSTSDNATVEGLYHFFNELTNDHEGSVISVDKDLCYVSGDLETITLWEEGAGKPYVIYSRELDDDHASDYLSKDVDTEVRLAEEIRDRFESLAGVRPGVMQTPYSVSDVEIRVGMTEREESDEFRRSLAYNEYGFEIKDGKICIDGTNVATLELAVDYFLEYIKSCIVIDARGNRSIVVRNNIRRTSYTNQWVVDIPEFEGGTFSGTNDADYDKLLIYYTDTTPEAFEAYCQKLEAEGYELWQRNDILDNLHAGYLSEKNFVYVYYTAYEKSVRIITSSAKGLVLPDTERSTGAKVTEPSITQLACDYARDDYGMGYIVTLEDGSFIVFDGGHYGVSTKEGTGHVNIYNTLKALNKRPDGKIVIAAWFVSHVHIDHYGAFREFCYKYGDKVTIEKVMFNTASESYTENSYNSDRALQKRLSEMQDAVNGGFDVVELLTGMQFYVREAKFQILATNDDVYPRRPQLFNDTTTVWRMTYEDQTSLWLGDTFTYLSDVLCARYGSRIGSDVMQLAHHGGRGGTKELYNLIKADFVFWPTSRSYYNELMKTSNKYYSVNSAAIKNALKVYVADKNITIPLPVSIGK